MRVFDKNELRRRVDEVLFYIWDPIGVSPEPCARMEYESYVSKVLGLVEQNDDIGIISSHLADIVKNLMGLFPNQEQCDHAATLLLEHKRAVKEGLA